MGYVDGVVRRGLNPSTVGFVKRSFQTHSDFGDDGPRIQVPGWGVAILVVTMVLFFVSMSAIEYTLKDVIATLAMVETPAAAITVSASEDTGSLKDTKEPLLEAGPTITLVHQKPITSSIRGTLRHLVSQAGRFSRWRGIKSFFLYQILLSFAANAFVQVIPNIPGKVVIVTGLSGALLANLHAAWTHKVIAMPTKMTLWQRIVPRTSWKVLAFPAAVEASAKYVALYIAQGFIVILGLDRVGNDNFAEYSGKNWASLGLRILAIFAIILCSGLFIVLPALVTLIRVEASILPEDQDTIVPFDRTFAGKVVPKVLGGSGCISFLEAWKSFNWEARGRLIKLYLKFFLIVVVMFIAFAHIIAFETWAIMGSQLGEFIAQAQRQGLNN